MAWKTNGDTISFPWEKEKTVDSTAAGGPRSFFGGYATGNIAICDDSDERLERLEAVKKRVESTQKATCTCLKIHAKRLQRLEDKAEKRQRKKNRKHAARMKQALNYRWTILRNSEHILSGERKPAPRIEDLTAKYGPGEYQIHAWALPSPSKKIRIANPPYKKTSELVAVAVEDDDTYCQCPKPTTEPRMISKDNHYMFCTTCRKEKR